MYIYDVFTFFQPEDVFHVVNGGRFLSIHGKKRDFQFGVGSFVPARCEGSFGISQEFWASARNGWRRAPGHRVTWSLQWIDDREAWHRSSIMKPKRWKVGIDMPWHAIHEASEMVSVFPNSVSDIDTKKRLHCKSWVFSSSLKACKCVQGNSMAARHCMVAAVGCNMLLQVQRVVPVLGKLPYFRLVPGWWNTMNWSNWSVSSYTTWLPREWVSFLWSLDGKELEGANMYRLQRGAKDARRVACWPVSQVGHGYRFFIMGFDVAFGLLFWEILHKCRPSVRKWLCRPPLATEGRETQRGHRFWCVQRT